MVKVVDYAEFNPVGDQDETDEEIILAASRLVSELVEKHRPASTLAILKIAKLYVDRLIADNIDPEAVAVFNEAADELLSRCSVQVLETEGDG